MNVSKLLIAASLAVATTGAFAETTVTSQPAGAVAQVYGRASAPNVRIVEAGQDTQKGDTKVAVQVGKDAIAFGRS